MRLRPAAALPGTVMAVVLVAGCGIGDVRRPGPVPSRTGAATTNPSPGPEVRRVKLPPGPGGEPTVEIWFADGQNAYALLRACDDLQHADRRCTAGLAATYTGGLTWQKLEHPQPVAGNQQMHVPRKDTVVLLAEPGGWYSSVDYGQSFRPSPGPELPREYFNGRRYERWCEPAPCRIRDQQPGSGPALTQPDLPGEVGGVWSTAGMIAVASVQDGRPYSSISTDQGQTWRRHEVPAPDGVRVTRVRLAGVPRLDDVWLYGYRAEDRTEFPVLWLWRGDGWRHIDAGDHPDRVTGLAPMGRGWLAVLDGGGRLGVVDEGYERRPEWPTARSVTTLSDGSLQVTGTDGVTWLGLDDLGPGGPRRRWVQIILEIG